MKELTEIRDGLFDIFEVDNVEDLLDGVWQAVTLNKTEKYEEYLELVEDDLETDYLQMVYQYYGADREVLKQDYTPKSLGKLLAKLTEDSSEILDLCAGSGALCVQAIHENPEIERIEAVEYDKNVIPFLLFNLAIRNSTAYITHGNAIDESEVFKKYILKKGDKFSVCHEAV
jgi:methylase of polypeptide subunit release factors